MSWANILNISLNQKNLLLHFLLFRLWFIDWNSTWQPIWIYSFFRIFYYLFLHRFFSLSPNLSISINLIFSIHSVPFSFYFFILYWPLWSNTFPTMLDSFDPISKTSGFVPTHFYWFLMVVVLVCCLNKYSIRDNCVIRWFINKYDDLLPLLKNKISI